MSNKRIDLTQFENHSPAPWRITEDMQIVVVPANHESTMEMRLYTGSGTNSRLIAKVPDLIAELKKLYEFMDLHQICGCGAICPNMNKETWARVKICGFCESAERGN